MKKPLPVDIDNFEEMIKDGYQYADKALFIKVLLDLKGEMNIRSRKLIRKSCKAWFGKGEAL